MTTWPAPQTWITDVDAADEAASLWPGPRPLTGKDGVASLVGRKNDLAEFVQNITQYKLTHLHGPSGVGKSSLLMAGIVPNLQDRGYTVALCRDWSNLGTKPFRVSLAQRLHDHLSDTQRATLSRNTDLFFELNAMRGSGVIILDQFEEVIRQGGKRRKEVFEFLTQIYLRFDIPVVLSYRSEHKEDLAEFDRDMRIDRPRTQRVLPVALGAGAELLKNPAKPAGAGGDWTWGSAITETAVQAISSYWETARNDDAHAQTAVGLLHLQALMFVLSRRKKSPLLDDGTFTTFVDEAAGKGFHTPHDVLTYALEESAAVRLEMARDVAGSGVVAMDRYLVRGITSMVTRIVPHLSSGGFKLERDVPDLAARTVLKDEFGAVQRSLVHDHAMTVDDATKLMRAAALAMLQGASTATKHDASILADDRTEIARKVDATLPLPLGPARWDELLSPADPRDLTAGPMMGQSPLAALLEQLRRIAWATLWLHQLNLARLNSDGANQSTLTLVHDGLGDSLQRWSARYQETDQTESLYALIAPEGESHDWASPGYEQDLSGRPGAPRMHANLRLRGNSIIGAKIHNAAFVNCDFRGTLFLRCTFQAVSFLNCRLDGALISDCTLDAVADPAPVQRPEIWTKDPVFVVPDTEGTTAADLGRYTGTSGTVVVSPAPGRPAQASPSGAYAVSWVEPSAGLAIEGSRLSAMTVRGTDFRHAAALAFVNVSGSGLDITELSTSDGGSAPLVEFRDSLLRHVAFTGHSGDEGGGTVNIDVSGSVLVQGWVARGLTGSFTAEHSLLGQWWVEPPAGGFTAKLGPGCKVIGVVGITPAEDTTRLDVTDRSLALDHIASAEDLADFRSKARLMDYRRD